jgi:hypothetical protein
MQKLRQDGRKSSMDGKSMKPKSPKEYLKAVNNNLECAIIAVNENRDLEAAEKLIRRAYINLQNLALSELVK